MSVLKNRQCFMTAPECSDIKIKSVLTMVSYINYVFKYY